MMLCKPRFDLIDDRSCFSCSLQSKLKEVKDMTAGLKARVREQHDRPEALEALKSMMKTSNTFYGKAANGTGVVDGYFTQAELDSKSFCFVHFGQAA